LLFCHGRSQNQPWSAVDVGAAVAQGSRYLIFITFSG
jgi:hypothetical protein